MQIDEIIALKDFVKSISEDNCHLYLWTTNAFMKSGFRVMEEWGFRYITIITWMKDRIGIGQYYRGITEHCLFGVKGNLPYKKDLVTGKRCQGRTGFTEAKTIHSRKPVQMRQMIELVSHEPRIELFARIKIDGWDCWGNEVESTNE